MLWIFVSMHMLAWWTDNFETFLWWYCKIYKSRCTSEYKRTYDFRAINSSLCEQLLHVFALGVTNTLMWI